MSIQPPELRVSFMDDVYCHQCHKLIITPIWALNDFLGEYTFRLECMDCTTKAIGLFENEREQKAIAGEVMPVYPPPTGE